MYSRLLTNRLLDMETCDIEREMLFIKKYKAEFGEQFNQKVD